MSSQRELLEASRNCLAAALSQTDALIAGLDEGETYYNQDTSPLGKLQFLRAAQEGAFPVTKAGRMRMALRSDVDKFLASKAGLPEPLAPDRQAFLRSRGL